MFLAANREELRSRPSVPPKIVRENGDGTWFGGRDQVAGGTWLGVNPHGLLVAITNRKDRPLPVAPCSRGLLCRKLLQCRNVDAAVDDCRNLLQAKPFAGFNLLILSPEKGVVVAAGRETRFHEIPPGLHVLTNAGFNVPEDARGELARREFETLLAKCSTDTPFVPATLIGEAAEICGQTSSDPSQPDLCLQNETHGTVSATIVAMPEDKSLAEYWFADGPPCTALFQSHSAEFRTLLAEKPIVSTHRINLKGPWEFEWITEASPCCPAVTSGRVTMPADWQSLFGDSSGRAIFRRRFNTPTNLTPADRVFAVFDAIGGIGSVSLNGVKIGNLVSSTAPQQFAMSHALQRFNELTVALQYDHVRDGRDCHRKPECLKRVSCNLHGSAVS